MSALPKEGTKVKTKSALGNTDGFFVSPLNLKARREGAEGVYRGWVPGHGGDVWWVDHADGGPFGAYCYDELEVSGEVSNDD